MKLKLLKRSNFVRNPIVCVCIWAGTDPRVSQRGPGPPLSPKFFFLPSKIFREQKKRGLGPPLVFCSGPLPKYHDPPGPPAHHPASPRPMNPPSPGAHYLGNQLKKKKKQHSAVSTKQSYGESKKTRVKKGKKRRE